MDRSRWFPLRQSRRKYGRSLQPAVADCVVAASGRSCPVVFDPAVADADDPLCVLGDCKVMGHHDDRNPGGVQLLEHTEELFAGPRVEISRRFVGEHERRTIDQRTGNRDALLLSAGHLARLMVHAVAKTHLLQQVAAPPVSFPIGNLRGRVGEGHHHVVEGIRPRQEVEALEDKADFSVRAGPAGGHARAEQRCSEEGNPRRVFLPRAESAGAVAQRGRSSAGERKDDAGCAGRRVGLFVRDPAEISRFADHRNEAQHRELGTCAGPYGSASPPTESSW